jgi:hypothetical protein
LISLAQARAVDQLEQLFYTPNKDDFHNLSPQVQKSFLGAGAVDQLE